MCDKNTAAGEIAAMGQHDIDSGLTKAFYYKGSKTGVLLIHGFTGTPSEMRYLGEYLKDKGYTVKAVLLKGHGTCPEDMRKTNHRDWISSVVEAYKELKMECEEVFAVGLSMGGLLSLYLARNYDLRGLVCLSTPIRILNKQAYYAFAMKYFKEYVEKKPHKQMDPYIIGYDRTPVRCIHYLFKLIRYVKNQLGKIDKPILIVQSYGDGTVNPVSGNIIYNQIGSKDKSIIHLHNSGHIVTCDCEKEQVFEEVYGFIRSKSRFKNESPNEIETRCV